MNSSKVIADIIWETIEFAVFDSVGFLDEGAISNDTQTARGWKVGLDYEKYRMMLGMQNGEY